VKADEKRLKTTARALLYMETAPLVPASWRTASPNPKRREAQFASPLAMAERLQFSQGVCEHRVTVAS
jgi:hypothetical protein